jgi:hypothetical protein
VGCKSYGFIYNIKQKLDQADWNALLGSLNDVDEMCNPLTETFVQIARERIPTKLLWAVSPMGLFITFLNLNKVIISESLLFCVLKRSEFVFC